jgi:hypothetical protein
VSNSTLQNRNLSDFAVGVGVAIEERGFLAKLSSGVSDFASSLAWKYEGISEENLWSEVYAPVARGVSEDLAAVERLGVRVVQALDLPGFADLIKEHAVVTLVAHWKGVRFEPWDFTEPMATIACLLNPTSSAQSRFAGRLPEDARAALRECRGPSDSVTNTISEQLGKALTAILASLCIEKSPQEELAYRRQLEKAFPGILTGSAVEFADGLHRVEDVAMIVPETFKGILDLTVCNSVVLGNLIRARVSCLVVVNRQPTPLGFRMRLYRSVMELVATGQFEFVDAVYELRKRLIRG